MASPRLRPSAAHGVAALAAVLAVVAYPFLASWAIGRWGVGALAITVLALGALTLIARVALDRSRLRNAALEHGGALLLAALALATGDELWLRLFPVLVNATLCVVFLASRSRDPCIVEEVARWIQPHTPDFVRSYCRAVTLGWAGFFASAAVGIGVVALLWPEAWRAASVPIYFGVLCILSALEFAFRKLWFRHYTRRRLDRWLARRFPADRTERGRRSLAHIQRMRELGLHQD